MSSFFFSSAPARVCLYGEHQDYLELKVIPSALNLRLDIISSPSQTYKIKGKSKQNNQTVLIPTNLKSLSKGGKDLQAYLEAGLLALKRYDNALEFPAIEFEINSKIPIASGLSSSAALLVAWINHFNGFLELDLDKSDIAELAYIAEHDILGIPCGRMDQYSSTYGGIISLECTNPPIIQKLKKPSFSMIVVDSKHPKLTNEVHGEKVELIKRACVKFEKNASKKLCDANENNLKKVSEHFSKSELKILQAVFKIRTATEEAEIELKKSNQSLEKLGKLLTIQQNALREGIDVSLPILDKIVKTGIENGALGGKLTGAGLGGSVVLLANKEDTKLAEKIRNQLNLPTWQVNVEKGTYYTSL